jgi:putative acetyltransferase
VDIRPEQPSDEASVRALHQAAFGEHGAVVAPLVDALRRSLRPEEDLSLVATDEQGVLGHVMFTRSLLDAPRALLEVSVLSPLAVLPGRQGAGIGSALVRRGLDLLAARRVPVVFLEGSPAYYSRFGFRPGAELGFRKPSLRIPDAAFQAVPLPAHEGWMTGTLVYSQVFWDHDAVGLREAG